MVNQGERFNNKEYREKFGVSRQTATRDLTDLEEKNLIMGKGKRRARYYVAR